MNANNGKGYEHKCSNGHSMWDAYRSHAGSQCLAYVDGLRCTGLYRVVGAGAKSANGVAA